MPSTVLGLPVHPLVVHAVVILVPLAALLLLASALSPRLRRWARVLTPVTAVVALVFVPLATSSGENLEGSVAHSHLVEEHAELGDTLLPLMAVVAVLAIVLFLLERRAASGRSMPGKALVTAVLVLSVTASLGTMVQVVRIGHSGAEAVWKGQGGGSESSAQVSGGSH